KQCSKRCGWWWYAEHRLSRLHPFRQLDRCCSRIRSFQYPVGDLLCDASLRIEEDVTTCPQYRSALLVIDLVDLILLIQIVANLTLRIHCDRVLVEPHRR